MSAAASSRFAPLWLEWLKALSDIKGELLIEWQIRQLRESGISDP